MKRRFDTSNNFTAKITAYIIVICASFLLTMNLLGCGQKNEPKTQKEIDDSVLNTTVQQEEFIKQLADTI